MTRPDASDSAALPGVIDSGLSARAQADDIRAVIAQRQAADAWHAPAQATAEAGADRGEGAREVAVHGTRAPASELPHLDRIQRSFGGFDVSGVQVHLGSAATEATAALRAEAYATGNHVVFSGQPSLRTAAHEAAHIVQQRAGLSLPGGFGQPGDPYERHADRVADAVVQGRSAEALLSRFAPASARTERESAVQRQASGVAVQLDPSKWYKATYPSASASMQDHFRRHPGPWKDTTEYTNTALAHYSSNKDKATDHDLADGTKGVKIRTSQYFGIYTKDGKIVTFGLR